MPSTAEKTSKPVNVKTSKQVKVNVSGQLSRTVTKSGQMKQRSRVRNARATGGNKGGNQSLENKPSHSNTSTKVIRTDKDYEVLDDTGEPGDLELEPFQASELLEVGLDVSSESEDESVSDQAKTKKHLFTSDEDLLLLREISCSRPFLGAYKEVPQKWIVSVSKLGGTFDVNSVRRRFEKLLGKFKSEQKASLLSSGTEEDYNEKVQLLGDIVALMESAALEKEQSSKKAKLEEVNRSKAEEIRNAALTGMLKTKGTKALGATRGNENEDVIEIFKNKSIDDNKFRTDELQFKKLKFTTMTTERQEERKLEIRRIEIQEKTQSQQNELMMELIRQLKK